MSKWTQGGTVLYKEFWIHYFTGFENYNNNAPIQVDLIGRVNKGSNLGNNLKVSSAKARSNGLVYAADMAVAKQK